MKEYKQKFIEFCLDNDVLSFGSFKLKSGRTSPYFFNAGKFNTGKALAKLGQFYSDALMDHIQTDKAQYDLIFGPAYKGIPLVSVMACMLSEKHGQDFPYAFNRKEAKDHGEGGIFVGSPVSGRVMVVDDVITAGTAIRETVELLSRVPNAKLAGVLVALDRMERGPNGGISAIEQIRKDYGIPVVCIVTLNEIVEYLETNGGQHGDHIAAIKQYQKEYGC